MQTGALAIKVAHHCPTAWNVAMTDFISVLHMFPKCFSAV